MSTAIPLSALLARVQTRRVQGPVEGLVTGVSADSRQLREGHLFVACPGLRQDGMRFVGDALAKGAVAVMAGEPVRVPAGICRIEVADARVALAQASKAFWRDASDRLELVGITGTNGKTTIAYLLSAVLTAADRRPGLLSTVQYRMGARDIPAARTTPDAPALHRLFAEMLTHGCRSAVMEVSSHALVQKRVEGVAFAAAVFTNLTRDHLDYHGTMEAYFEAKASLFDGLARLGRPTTAIVNRDDPWGRRLIERVGDRIPLLTYGLEPGAAIGAEALTLAADGSRFRIRTPWGDAEVRTGLLGRHNVSNVLATVAAAGALGGIPLDRIVATLADAPPAPGRLQEVAAARGFRVYIDYAHSDDALAHVLRTVREVTTGRVLLVFGCGGERDAGKRPVMGAVAARLADRVVVTSDNPRGEDPEAIIAQILAGAAGAAHLEAEPDRRRAIARALNLARAGDLVLIAGKGHETFQEVSGRAIAFDDAQVVRELLALEPTA